MEAPERRNKSLRILCRRRYETVPNLAFKFGVSTRTIRRDEDICVLQKMLDFAISAETILTQEEIRRLQDIIALYSKPNLKMKNL